MDLSFKSNYLDTSGSITQTINKYLLGTYYVSETVLGTVDATVNKIEFLPLKSLPSGWGGDQHIYKSKTILGLGKCFEKD